MINPTTIKKVAQAFVEDACHYLAMDSNLICINYVPKIKSVVCKPQNKIAGMGASINIGSQFLDSLDSTKYKMLRPGLYALVRHIAQRIKNKDSDWSQRDPDTNLFAAALMLLKGHVVYSNVLESYNSKDQLLEILNSEFKLSGKLVTIPIKGKDKSFLTFVLDDCSTTKYFQKLNNPSNFTGKVINEYAKGSKENPFDNVTQAVDFLNKIEHEAYEKDKMMKEISNLGYYYDMNSCRFVRTWASPYVAHTRNNFGEHAFVMSQMEPLDHKRPDIYFFSLKPNMYKCKFLYRGQSDHYEGFPCVPNLFRNPEQNAKRDFLDPLIFSQEMELLIKSHPIVQMLEQGIELLHDKFSIRMHYIGIAQHYYNKTPYLDLTSDLEVAKFFATTNYDATHDCYTPNTDTSRTGVIYYYELKYPDAFQQHHIYTSRTFGKQMFQTSEYALKTIGKQVFLRSGLQSGFLLEMEQEVDFKTLPEVKAVYFKHNVDISEEIFRKSGQGKKYFAEDILQHAWHDRLKERYQNRVVSREAVRLNVSRNEGETEKTIIAKLKDRGIEVDNYVPKFSEEELSSFYQDIDQWWEDFCSDIHFGDAEDELYRETMKQLRHDPKYSKYFTFNK